MGATILKIIDPENEKFFEFVTKNDFLKFKTNRYKNSIRNFKKDFIIFIFLTSMNSIIECNFLAIE